MIYDSRGSFADRGELRSLKGEEEEEQARSLRAMIVLTTSIYSYLFTYAIMPVLELLMEGPVVIHARRSRHRFTPALARNFLCGHLNELTRDPCPLKCPRNRLQMSPSPQTTDKQVRDAKKIISLVLVASHSPPLVLGLKIDPSRGRIRARDCLLLHLQEKILAYLFAGYKVDFSAN